MWLAKHLVRRGVQFSQMMYPDQGHFLAGVKEHLFGAVERFLKKCLLDDDKRTASVEY